MIVYSSTRGQEQLGIASSGGILEASSLMVRRYKTKTRHLHADMCKQKRSTSSTSILGTAQSCCSRHNNVVRDSIGRLELSKVLEFILASLCGAWDISATMQRIIVCRHSKELH